jgi:hypothetical protein
LHQRPLFFETKTPLLHPGSGVLIAIVKKP